MDLKRDVKISYRFIQMKEAYRRMSVLTKRFNLDPSIKEDLEKGIVTYSRWAVVFGCSQPVDSNEQYLDCIKEFQRKTGGFVYYSCLLSSFEYPDREQISMLYVSAPSRFRWLKERFLWRNRIYAYVYSLDSKKGEYRRIKLTSRDGVLLKMGMYQTDEFQKEDADVHQGKAGTVSEENFYRRHG